MDGLISFKDISGVANNLIDKISQAIGWVANIQTDKKKARNLFIKEIENSDLSPLDKASRIAMNRKIIKEYCNQTNIVQNALKDLEKSARPDLMDEDWVAQFMDKARLVSNEEFQIIWGRILAEEANQPNTISKRLLHNLSLMTSEDANNFLNLGRFCFLDKNNQIFHPIIYIKKHASDYANSNINTNMLNDLEQFSLIETNYDAGFVFYRKKVLVYCNTVIEVKGNRIPVGNVKLTSDGQKLMRLISKKDNSQILEYTIEKLQYFGSEINTSRYLHLGK